MPSRRKRLDPQRALQQFARMRREIEQRIDLGDGHALPGLADLHDLVAGADLALAQDAEIESRPAARRQQRRHPRLVGANAEPIAGHARLGDLEQRAADLIAVTDANGIVGQILDGEILSELAEDVSPSSAVPASSGAIRSGRRRRHAARRHGRQDRPDRRRPGSGGGPDNGRQPDPSRCRCERHGPSTRCRAEVRR